MNRIIAAIDFSPASADVLGVARRLASATGASLELVHVYSLPEHPLTYARDKADVDHLIAEGAQLARQRFAELAGNADAALVPLYGQEEPAMRIANYARHQDADIIVAGSHGHGAAHDVLVGSTIRTILREGPCPVLVVPVRRPAV